MPYQSASELARRLRAGELTSTGLVEASLARIGARNPSLQAVVALLEREALRTAAERDRETGEGRLRGPLHGIPMTVKEQFWVEGTKCTLNSRMLRKWTAPGDAMVVRRLRDAGAVIVGKTNVPRNLLDYQVSGDIYPEASNPYDLSRSPGGSSGGSAIALAAGMTPLELGGDFGGSIRVPAHFCGVYGLKTTEKTIPEHGMGPVTKGSEDAVWHMAVAGPMARTVEDLELLWKVIRGPYEGGGTAPAAAWADASGRSLGDYRVAWVDGWPGYPTSSQTREVIHDLVASLEQRGGRLEQASPANDLHRRSLALYVRLFPQIIAQAVPRPVRVLLKLQLRRSLLKGMNTFRTELNQGFRLGPANYAETMAMRGELIREWDGFFREFDLLVCPVSFGPAYRRCRTGTPISWDGSTLVYIDYVWPYVACFNASGHPAIAIPLGLGQDGLPVGVQVAGPYRSEPDLIRFASLIAESSPGFVQPDAY